MRSWKTPPDPEVAKDRARELSVVNAGCMTIFVPHRAREAPRRNSWRPGGKAKDRPQRPLLLRFRQEVQALLRRCDHSKLSEEANQVRRVRSGLSTAPDRRSDGLKRDSRSLLSWDYEIAVGHFRDWPLVPTSSSAALPLVTAPFPASTRRSGLRAAARRRAADRVPLSLCGGG